MTSRLTGEVRPSRASPTRDPLARSVSSFNFDHIIGGGAKIAANIMEDWYVPEMPEGCTSECSFCVAGDTFETDPAFKAQHRPGKGILAPYLMPNMSEAPLVYPCDHSSSKRGTPATRDPRLSV